MMLRMMPAALLIGAVFLGVSARAEPAVEVVTREDFDLVPLNPLRGYASPKAGVLWGDLRRDVPTGALIQFADGFSSPPHIHNITYRAVVIDGTVHNDDPAAETLWMEPGSFWTQPAGETHITAVGPGGGMAFLEIDSGPYLVRPAQEAFDSGERPVNIEARNVVWLAAADTEWIRGDARAAGPEMAFLWGSPAEGQRNGTFLRLPAGHAARLETGGTALKAVLVKGGLTHSADGLAMSRSLDPGSYIGSEGTVSHSLTCTGTTRCVLYVSADGRFRIVEAP